MNLLQKFRAQDNKILASIANIFLYLGGPVGTMVILILKAKNIVSADESTELIAAWVSVVGGFKFITKFTKEPTQQNEQ